MHGQLPPTRTDRILHRLRDHPILAVVIVAALAMIGVAQATDSGLRIWRMVPGRDTISAQTYRELKYALQDFDRQVEALGRLEPSLLPAAISGAGAKARTICAYEPTLVAMDDDLGVRTVQRTCPFANAVDSVDALFAAYPHRAENPDANVRQALLFLRLEADGIRTFVRDSAGRLLRD